MSKNNPKKPFTIWLKKSTRLGRNSSLPRWSAWVLAFLVVVFLGISALDLELFATARAVLKRHNYAPQNTTPHLSRNSHKLANVDFKNSIPLEISGSVRKKPIKIPILMYHRVDDVLIPGNRYAAGLTVSVENFESQLKYLNDNHYQTVGLTDLYNAIYAGIDLPSKAVILTFDDGYQDNYTNAFPLLVKYKQKGTFFIVSGSVGKNPNYMTSAEIKEMSDWGMDIESHTVTHPNLATLSKSALDGQLVNSKKDLEAITHKQVLYLAYPSGRYTALVQQEAKTAGYLMAVTTNFGSLQDPLDPFGLFRKRINPRINGVLLGQLLN